MDSLSAWPENHHGCDAWQGDMARRIAAFDWRDTALGPREHWSRSLNAAVQLLLASPVPLVMLWGQPGTMIYNDAYAGFAGGRHPFLLGKPVEEGWPEIADFNRNVVDTCLAGGTLSYTEKQLQLHRNGQPEDVWMDLHYSPVAEDDGRPAGVIAIVFETTGKVVAERKRDAAERAFREASERLNLALSSGLVLGTWIWDIEHGVITGDDRFRKTFALDASDSADPLPAEAIRARLYPQDLERFDSVLRDATSSDDTYRAEYRIRMTDGEYRWVLASGRCEYGADGRLRRLPGVLVDIHERKKAEDALLRLTQTLEERVAQEVRARIDAEDRLRQVQKLEAIGSLTGGVAHDFNNVLQIISANLQLIEVVTRENGGLKRRLEVANNAVARGAKLASQLLAFARRQPLSPSVLNPVRMLDSLAELMHRTLPETIVFEMAVAESAWPVFADRNQLENALLNLVINSRDAIQGAGRIRLCVDNVEADHDPRLKALNPRGAQYVRFAVEDNGGGMPEHVKARVFEPFYSTKAEGHGTGLGLSMVFGFVSQSAGFIDIETAMGEGTTVSLYFPRTHREATAERPVVQSRGSHGGETILVAEDDAEVRLAAIDMLAQLGYKVLSAPDGDAALAVLQQQGHIDLLFTDVVMPGTVRSNELARIASAPPHRAKVVFASGYTRDIIFHEGRLDEGVVLLNKPYSMDDLARTVRAALDAPPKGERTD